MINSISPFEVDETLDCVHSIEEVLLKSLIRVSEDGTIKYRRYIIPFAQSRHKNERVGSCLEYLRKVT